MNPQHQYLLDRVKSMNAEQFAKFVIYWYGRDELSVRIYGHLTYGNFTSKVVREATVLADKLLTNTDQITDWNE